MENENGAVLAQLHHERTKLLESLSAPNTRRGYAYDWAAFVRWCQKMQLTPLPATPETLAIYVTARLSAGKKISTTTRNAAAVRAVHRFSGQPSPLDASVLDVLRAARRTRVEDVRQVRPVTTSEIRAIAELLVVEGTPVAARNRAIVIVGFAAALRTATMAGLSLADVEFSDRGASLRIHREKQDQEGRGRLIGLPHGKHPETCPVGALREWITRRGSFAGPLFTRFNGGAATKAMQPERFGQVVQQCLERIGCDRKLYGGHSLRAGFVTEAGQLGAGELLIAAQTGHRDMSTLRRYFRRQDVFRHNACAMLDL